MKYSEVLLLVIISFMSGWLFTDLDYRGVPLIFGLFIYLCIKFIGEEQ